MSFADLGLSEETLKAVTEKGYSEPTPIQAQAIPAVLMNKDILGIAQTGTGKTASFTLPMIDILSEGRAKARMPRSLILAPTRELAHQVADNFTAYGKYHRLNMALLIGGESMSEQQAKLERGVDVLIATPGRLLDLFERGRILLNDVKILVIDEADRMLDMGFIPDIEKIVGKLPVIRQTLLFSATMAKEIRRIADAFLMNPKEISVARQATTAETVEQRLIVTTGREKRDALVKAMQAEDVANAFVFCNRKRDIATVHRSLEKAGFAVVSLHGDMTQPTRMEMLGKFKAGEAKMMVCSDVAARGLDVPAVSHVVNYDVPSHPEDYVHRIGRTGRAGMEGKALTLATPEDRKYLQLIEKLIGKPIPRADIPEVKQAEIDPAQSANIESANVEATDGDITDGDTTNGDTTNAGPPPQEKKPRRSRSRKPKGEAPKPETAQADSQAGAEAPTAQPDAQPEAQPDAKPDAKPGAEAPTAQPDAKPEGDAKSDRGGRRDSKPRSKRRRDRGQEGIGEMKHGDNVVAFGDHVPDFITREVPIAAARR